MSRADDYRVSGFAFVPGEVEVKAADIVGFEEIWASVSPNTAFATAGCATFRKMTGPAYRYLADSVRATLADPGVEPERVDHVVIATTDRCLGLLGPDFATELMASAGLVNAIPVLVSFQQCCSSVTALQHGWDLFAAPDVRNVVVTSIDLVADDADRVRSFALFGDAATSCLISRDVAGGLRLRSTAIGLDRAGLTGQDSFQSRQQVARGTVTRALRDAGKTLDQVTRVFTTNLYAPLTTFGAAMTGIRRDTLHYADTMLAYGHCGNGDWLINLVDHRDRSGLHPGEIYLAQASAPGFYAGAVLENR